MVISLFIISVSFYVIIMLCCIIRVKSIAYPLRGLVVPGKIKYLNLNVTESLVSEIRPALKIYFCGKYLLYAGNP